MFAQWAFRLDQAVTQTDVDALHTAGASVVEAIHRRASTNDRSDSLGKLLVEVGVSRYAFFFFLFLAAAGSFVLVL
jgi:hypothetical protein